MTIAITRLTFVSPAAPPDAPTEAPPAAPPPVREPSTPPPPIREPIPDRGRPPANPGYCPPGTPCEE